MNNRAGVSLALLLGFGAFCANAAFAQKEPPVEIIADHFVPISTAHGTGKLPMDFSLDWDQPQPQVTRAVIIFHGKGRDVDGYYRGLRKAAALAGKDAEASAILIAPQFLNEEDAHAHKLDGSVYRWQPGTWESGRNAEGPAAVSSFEIIDALVAHLADRKLYPNLKTIVLAGHSGGGQALDRYAVVGRAEAAAGAGIHIRYVIANPSSYLYFTDDRPVFDGNKLRFAPMSDAACRNFNHWRYGPADVREEYVRDSAFGGWQKLEDAYAQKDVTYLLGTADVDPHERDLDVTCAGEVQGPNRFLRGQAYYAYLHVRHKAAWNQRMWFVPGVAHNAGKMYDSECGVASLFEKGSCTDQP